MRPDILIDGYAYGSLSMTCFTTNCQPAASTGIPQVTFDTASTAPADQSNL